MMFERGHKVLFRHCDPAGLVFYPRYFEMLNDHVEAFFEHIGHPLEALHKVRAVPTAEVSATFQNPSRHGEELTWSLSLTRLGWTSAGLEVTVRAGAETRAEFRSTSYWSICRARRCRDQMRCALVCLPIRKRMSE